jgi:hypothetical protein
MSTTAISVIETLRANLHAHIDAACNDTIAQISPFSAPQGVIFKIPTQADGHDPRNKNGQNLTPRGVEILYRVFDDGGGYNRAAKMLNISQGAAKNRKGTWTKAGGLSRVKQVLDIDGD